MFTMFSNCSNLTPDSSNTDKEPQLNSNVDFLFIVTPIVAVCNISTFCCTLLNVHSSIAIILMEKNELVALLPGIS